MFIVFAFREVKVHVSKVGMSKGGISYAIMRQFDMAKKKQGPMDQLLYTLTLNKVWLLPVMTLTYFPYALRG